jgi:hypothetical protein
MGVNLRSELGARIDRLSDEHVKTLLKVGGCCKFCGRTLFIGLTLVAAGALVAIDKSALLSYRTRHCAATAAAAAAAIIMSRVVCPQLVTDKEDSKAAWLCFRITMKEIAKYAGRESAAGGGGAAPMSLTIRGLSELPAVSSSFGACGTVSDEKSAATMDTADASSEAHLAEFRAILADAAAATPEAIALARTTVTAAAAAAAAAGSGLRNASERGRGAVAPRACFCAAVLCFVNAGAAAARAAKDGASETVGTAKRRMSAQEQEEKAQAFVQVSPPSSPCTACSTVMRPPAQHVCSVRSR